MKRITDKHPAARALDALPARTNLDIIAHVDRTAATRSTYASLGFPGSDQARARRAAPQHEDKFPKFRMDPVMRRNNDNPPHQRPVASAVEHWSADDIIANHLALLRG